MKHLGCLLFLLASPASADDWQHPPDATSMPPGSSSYISANALFEVPASTLDRAVAALTTEPFISLSPAATANYSHGHFSCKYPEQAYLARAVYENEATGTYTVKSNGKAFWVSHESLGPASGRHKSALIVCLRFKPQTLFVTTSGAL